MPVLRSLSAVLVCASLLPAAEPVKLRTLTGQTIEGDLVAVNDKEVVVRGKDGPVTTPLAQVLDLDLQANAMPAEARYSDVELTDGSLLHCTQFVLRGKQVELKLAGSAEVKLPLAAVSYLLHDAQDAKVREEWHASLGKRGNSDLLAVKDAQGTVNTLDGTFGEGDDQGTTIGFETATGAKRRLNLSRIHALAFLRKLDPAAAAPVAKLYDTSRNVLAAARVELGEAGFTLTTPSGVRVDFPRDQVTRIDFNNDKLRYLSDLEPKAVERSNVDWLDHYRRDKSLDNGPLRLGKESYPKGLAVHAYAELVYDLGGQYKEFKTILGVDPKVGGDSDVTVTIEGDGQKLFSEEIKRKDEPRPLTLQVANVKLLRIVVRSNGLLDLGNHVNLADAKVSK